MLEWLAQTIGKHTLGYAIQWYRSRLKVSLATHIEQSWSERSIQMSITNHGKTSIIVDSWTVHIPLEDLLPELAEKDFETERPSPGQFGGLRRVAGRVGRLIYSGNHIANMNDLSRAWAHSILREPHLRHELLGPGTRQRIEAGESVVRTFPQPSAISQTPTISSDAEQLTLIPSCHIVGHRGRLWGFPSHIFGGPIPMAIQFNAPRIEEDE